MAPDGAGNFCHPIKSHMGHAFAVPYLQQDGRRERLAVHDNSIVKSRKTLEFQIVL